MLRGSAFANVQNFDLKRATATQNMSTSFQSHDMLCLKSDLKKGTLIVANAKK